MGQPIAVNLEERRLVDHVEHRPCHHGHREEHQEYPCICAVEDGFDVPVPKPDQEQDEGEDAEDGHAQRRAGRRVDQVNEDPGLFLDPLGQASRVKGILRKTKKHPITKMNIIFLTKKEYFAQNCF